MSLNLIILFVLLVVGVLIVVASSIATIDLGCADKNLYAKLGPSPDEKDSTFIIKIRKSVPGSNKVFKIFFCLTDLSDVFHKTVLWLI